MFSLPTTVSNSQIIIGYIDASNTNPQRYWDGITLTSDKKIYLAYIENSARYMNRGIGDIVLSNDIVSYGMPIGYDRFDGKIPGGYGYEGVISIKIRVHTSVTSELRITARIKGTSYFSNEVYANIGDKIEFRVKYVNLTAEIQKNVMIRDVLPNNLEYINGSTFLYNANFKDGTKLKDESITTTGINIGDYLPTGNASVIFTAMVADNVLADGKNELVNWASVTVNDEVYKDFVLIKVCLQ